MSEQNAYIVEEKHITHFSSFITAFPTHSHNMSAIIDCVFPWH